MTEEISDKIFYNTSFDMREINNVALTLAKLTEKSSIQHELNEQPGFVNYCITSQPAGEEE
ncbi:hypothetical protein MC885_009315 [Smutsia gigantea]|nr:hypothetical protein MC885_009315 [Smutsia gigantea]